MWLKILALGIGGFIGSNLRYWVSNWVAGHFESFPYGTLLVNVIGSFIIGFLIILDTEVIKIAPLIRLSIASGLIGALTTFSTFSLETFNYLKGSNYLPAILNVALNVGVGLCAVELGFLAAKAVFISGQDVVFYKING